MNYRSASRLCILLACSLLLGCAAEPLQDRTHLREVSAEAASRYWEQWQALRYQPVESYGEWGPAAEDGQDVEDTTVTSYGDYIVVTWDDLCSTVGAALLMDKDGQAIWAGAQVFPMRRAGEMTSLLLVEGGHGSPGDYDAMGRVGWFDLTSPLEGEVRYVELGTSQLDCKVDPKGRFDGRPSSGIVDIDGDGTDEFLLVQKIGRAHV